MKLFLPSLLFLFSAATAFAETIYERAPVVLVVENHSSGEGDKYHWYSVTVVKVIKNDTKSKFEGTLKVASSSAKPSIPQGKSIIYLEPYGGETKDWKTVWETP